MSKLSIDLPQVAGVSRQGAPLPTTYSPFADGLQAIHPSFVLPIKGLDPGSQGLQACLKVVAGMNGGVWCALEVWEQGMSRPASVSINQLTAILKVVTVVTADENGVACNLGDEIMAWGRRAASAGLRFLAASSQAASTTTQTTTP